MKKYHRKVNCPICGKRHRKDYLEIINIGTEDGNSDDGLLPHLFVYIYCNFADMGLMFYTDIGANPDE